MVSTHLKNISQIGLFPQVRVKIKNLWNHQLVLLCHCCLNVTWIIRKSCFLMVKSLKMSMFWRCILNVCHPISSSTANMPRFRTFSHKESVPRHPADLGTIAFGSSAPSPSCWLRTGWHHDCRGMSSHKKKHQNIVAHIENQARYTPWN